MPNKTITLSRPGINWCWYLRLETVGKTKCLIKKHWRVHFEDSGHQTSNGKYHIIEDHKPIKDGWHSRNVIAVTVWRGKSDGEKGKRLTVMNPGYIFGYDGHTNQPAMHGDN